MFTNLNLKWIKWKKNLVWYRKKVYLNHNQQKSIWTWRRMWTENERTIWITSWTSAYSNLNSLRKIQEHKILQIDIFETELKELKGNWKWAIEMSTIKMKENSWRLFNPEMQQKKITEKTDMHNLLK